MPVELSPSLRCTHVAHLLPSFCFGSIYRWATISSVYLLIILPVCVVSCLWCVRVCAYAFPFPFVIVSVALPGCWWFDCDFMARNVVDASIAGELSTLKRIEGGKGMGEKGSAKGSQDASAWSSMPHTNDVPIKFGGGASQLFPIKFIFAFIARRWQRALTRLHSLHA